MGSYSATAYQAVKESLQIKYGGKRQKITLCLKKLDRFYLMKRTHPKDMKRVLRSQYFIYI